jgi:hypothetical protein
MTEVAVAETPSVLTGVVAVLVPAPIVTEPMIVAAAVFELVSVTSAPVPTASPVSVMVALAGLPPTTLAGASVIEDSAAGVTVRFAVFVTPA